MRELSTRAREKKRPASSRLTSPSRPTCPRNTVRDCFFRKRKPYTQLHHYHPRWGMGAEGFTLRGGGERVCAPAGLPIGCGTSNPSAHRAVCTCLTWRRPSPTDAETRWARSPRFAPKVAEGAGPECCSSCTFYLFASVFFWVLPLSPARL